MSNTNEQEQFWKVRAGHYDKLFWTKDKDYITCILNAAEINNTNVVLDVGTGTGTIAKKVSPLAKRTIAIDLSNEMLKQGDWDGISAIEWDINDKLFCDGVFDRVIARMVFHHILDNFDRAMTRCYDYLKPKGKLVIAEGVPPTDDQDVVEWYTEMFKLKEDRRTFVPSDLTQAMYRNGFSHVALHEHHMSEFNVNNWLKNSGLEQSIQDRIIAIHWDAPDKIKQVYNMRKNAQNECIIETKNVIVVGTK